MVLQWVPIVVAKGYKMLGQDELRTLASMLRAYDARARSMLKSYGISVGDYHGRCFWEGLPRVPERWSIICSMIAAVAFVLTVSFAYPPIRESLSPDDFDYAARTFLPFIFAIWCAIVVTAITGGMSYAVARSSMRVRCARLAALEADMCSLMREVPQDMRRPDALATAGLYRVLDDGTSDKALWSHVRASCGHGSPCWLVDVSCAVQSEMGGSCGAVSVKGYRLDMSETDALESVEGLIGEDGLAHAVRKLATRLALERDGDEPVIIALRSSSGDGRTTVARALGCMLLRDGVISTGDMASVHADGLVCSSAQETCERVDAVLSSASGSSLELAGVSELMCACKQSFGDVGASMVLKHISDGLSQLEVGSMLVVADVDAVAACEMPILDVDGELVIDAISDDDALCIFSEEVRSQGYDVTQGALDAMLMHLSGGGDALPHGSATMVDAARAVVRIHADRCDRKRIRRVHDDAVDVQDVGIYMESTRVPLSLVDRVRV